MSIQNLPYRKYVDDFEGFRHIREVGRVAKVQNLSPKTCSPQLEK